MAGYQPTKKRPFVSGLGGSKKPDEHFMDTAIRETIEELFDIYDHPKRMIDELKMIQPKNVYQNGTYINVIYSFIDLRTFLLIMSKYKTNVKLYRNFPCTLHTLLNERLIQKASEVSHLILLPLVDHDPATPFVDPLFVKDMSAIKNLISPTTFIIIK